MPYRYRCEQCCTTSHPLPTRRAARDERDWHRARVHAGHIPDGESINPDDSDEGTGLAGLLLAILIGCVIAAALARLTH
ncbi:hypothetical protein [Streptomyces sp. NPDC056242]|uniref:hypothetical protein n=1 Tax=Streptomyces sp. NPDC056242 TaxID=3345760 RepID=UPI0035DE6A2B